MIVRTLKKTCGAAAPCSAAGGCFAASPPSPSSSRGASATLSGAVAAADGAVTSCSVDLAQWPLTYQTHHTMIRATSVHSTTAIGVSSSGASQPTPQAARRAESTTPADHSQRTLVRRHAEARAGASHRRRLSWWARTTMLML